MANVNITEEQYQFEGIRLKGNNNVYNTIDRNARNALTNIQISLDSNYQTPTKVQELTSPQTNDNFQTAIQKLNNGIVGDEEIWAAALNQIEDDINDAFKLPSTYTASSLSNTSLNPIPNDTYITAISKLHKSILDMQDIWGLALNNLNSRTKILEDHYTGLYDILWVKISDSTQKRVTHNVLNPSEGYKPIALRVIAENFLGQGEPSRWMSLKYMYFDNMNTTETGTQPYLTNAQTGSLTNMGMTWDETSVYTPKTSTYTQEQLNTSRFKSNWANINYTWPDLSFGSGTYNDDKFTNTTRVSKTYDWGYLPSDVFTNYYSVGSVGSIQPSPDNLFYRDGTRGWHSDALTNNRILPPLYTEDNIWIISKASTEFTSSNSLSYIHGKEATQKIVDQYTNTAPLSGNTTYVGKCLFTSRLQELKPFYCCSQYRTLGTVAGDWYLPACGELAFIIPDLKHIRARLTEISSLYPEDCMSSLANAYYWSASEYYLNIAWSVYTTNGNVGNHGKSYQFTVLAFLQFSA